MLVEVTHGMDPELVDELGATRFQAAAVTSAAVKVS